VTTPSSPTRLIVLRGNSASGKSSVATGLARHATKPIADEVTEHQLREWYRPLDVLPGGVETVVPAASPLEETVERVLRESGLCDVLRSGAR
jgi:chloramphenicol 3-O-phosphotransferase